MLHWGAARADTTPELGLRTAGTAPYLPAEGVAGPLHGRVIVVDDGARRAAIVCLDLMALTAGEVALLRARLAAVGDLDPAAILVACSHTHAAPFTFLAGDAAEPEVLGYLDFLYERLAGAMADAVAALRPAELVVGRAAAPGWAFNRRPIYADEQVATHGPTWGAGFVRLEDAPDEEVQIVLAREPGGATLGGLVSFACHPTVMESQPVYSSDFAGALAAELEARHGGTFGFLLGASGDTANLDPSDRDEGRWFGWDHALAMGKALADRADVAIDAGRIVAGTPVASAAAHLAIPQRRPTPEQIRLARWYLEEAPPDLDERAFTRRFTGHAHTFYDLPPRANERHARQLLGMWAWQARADTRNLVETVEMQALTLGEVAIVAYPVELFTAFGRRLKAQSPFPDTLVATQANGWHGYAPTPEAFARGGYEPQLAYQSRLVPEAGDRMTDAALALLRRAS